MISLLKEKKRLLREITSINIKNICSTTGFDEGRKKEKLPVKLLLGREFLLWSAFLVIITY